MTTLGRPPMFDTVQQLETAIEEYFEGLRRFDKDGNEIEGKRPTVAGLAYHLGYASRQSLYDQKERGHDFSYTYARAILFIESFHEENLSGKYNSSGSQFWLKNHKWADKQPEGQGEQSTLRILVETQTDMSNVELNLVKPEQEKTPE